MLKLGDSLAPTKLCLGHTKESSQCIIEGSLIDRLTAFKSNMFGVGLLTNQANSILMTC